MLNLLPSFSCHITCHSVQIHPMCVHRLWKHHTRCKGNHLVNAPQQYGHSRFFWMPGNRTHLASNRIFYSHSQTVYKAECLKSQCETCGVTSAKDSLLAWFIQADSGHDILQWHRWKSVSIIVKEKVFKRMTMVAVVGSRKALLEEFIEQLKPLSEHIFVEYTQSCAFRKCCQNWKVNEVAVVVDFAEYYTCLRQGEVPSAYYTRNQVTFHPMVVTMHPDSPVKCHFVFLISDDIKHDKEAVAQFLRVLIQHIQSLYPEVLPYSCVER